MRRLFDEYREELLGSWLDLRAFLRDRRFLMTEPRTALGSAQRAIANRPLQFGIQAILFPTLAVSLVQATVETLVDVPPTAIEREIAAHVDTLRQLSIASESAAARLRFVSDSFAGHADPELLRVDTLELRARAENIGRRLDSVLALRSPGESAIAVADERVEEISQRILGYDSGMGPEGLVAELFTNMALRNEILGASSDTLRERSAQISDLGSARSGLVAADLSQQYLAISVRRDSANAVQERRLEETVARMRAVRLIDRFDLLLVPTAVLLAGMVFHLLLKVRFRTARVDGAKLYLYLVSAFSFVPTLLYAVLFWVDDLAGSFGHSLPVGPMRLISLAAFVYVLVAVTRAGAAISDVIGRDAGKWMTVEIALGIVIAQVATWTSLSVASRLATWVVGESVIALAM